MAHEAVSNTGPILHLNQINLLRALNVFSRTVIPNEVMQELQKNKTLLPSKITIKELSNESKDKAMILINQHDLDLGEAEAIALALQEKAEYFLTDDLDARQVAKAYHIKVHGTIGIILRAFKRNIINKKEAINKIRELKSSSSLFITQDLIDETINAIEDFSG